jgi:hypothetical protein
VVVVGAGAVLLLLVVVLVLLLLRVVVVPAAGRRLPVDAVLLHGGEGERGKGEGGDEGTFGAVFRRAVESWAAGGRRAGFVHWSRARTSLPSLTHRSQGRWSLQLRLADTQCLQARLRKIWAGRGGKWD